MSAVQTWTLWQRMPPRYQLTTHTFDNDADDFTVIGNATDRTQSPRTLPSSRPVSSGRRTSRPDSRSLSFRETYRETTRDTHKDSFMLSSNQTDLVQNEISRALKQQTSKSFSFPKRNSDYVSTFQKQRRVNSARRRLAEAPPSPNVTASQQTPEVLTSPRAHTAPQFPVTNPETHKEKQPKISETAVPDAKSLRINIKSKSIGEPSKVDMFQFDDTKSVSSTTSSVHKSRDSETKAKKYVVQDTDRATVYLDSGKVMYFGKSRHDLTQLLKTQSLRADRSNCFLAEIRRDYLKHPKYDRGRNTHKKPENDPRRIANERVDYNRRVEHILNYYDENGNIAKPSQSRPTSGLRVKSPKGARVKGLSLTPAAPSRPPSRTPSPDPLDANSDFIRLNRQLKLHERQFYLRTPGMQHGNSVADLDKCRCSMCRMELQLALVTGFVAHTGLNMKANEAVADPDQAEKKKDTDFSNNPKEKSNEFIKTNKKNVNGKNSTQKVSFQHPEVELVAQAQETRFISCKLPEVDQVTVSESGFESARTHDVVSTGPDDIDTEL
ncbi:uncharacterized protein LOC123547696 [Mercenaria mercenaria]|uniref:uncharacterized protein LOC123547696 n=1 Tax=Mercenaria mercenaria TaxID=6596 RepID=UPI00234F8F03|nr:uncharacterized protein LOC123547696 [Mercenaria mercenaria]